MATHETTEACGSPRSLSLQLPQLAVSLPSFRRNGKHHYTYTRRQPTPILMKAYHLSGLVGALYALAPLAAQAAPMHDLMGDLWARAGSSVTSDVGTAKAKNYTHVVVGCGLAGLTVAVRLSEDEKNTVLCLEAGGDSRKDDRGKSPWPLPQILVFGADLPLP